MIMATVINYGDIQLQNTVPRLTNVTLNTNVVIPALKQITLTANNTIFNVDASGLPNIPSITINATLKQISETLPITWEIISGNAILSGTNNTSRTLEYASMSTTTVTVQASITDSSDTYRATININKVQEGSSWAALSGKNTLYGPTRIALGQNAGTINQADNTVSLGVEAGKDNQAIYGVALGYFAGQTSQADSSIAIGKEAGKSIQYTKAIAIGGLAGSTTQRQEAIAIGYQAGNTNQQQYSVSIGSSSGVTAQGQYSVALGYSAANANQGQNAVAIGNASGSVSQGNYAISIGHNSGQITSADYSISIGAYAGFNNQNTNAIAIGSNAGKITQGSNAIAIGNLAGETAQAANSIVINATGVLLQNTTNSSLKIAPIRNSLAAPNVLYYNTATNEVTYDPVVVPLGGLLTHNILPSSQYQFVQASPSPGWTSQATTGKHVFLHSGSLKSLTATNSGSPSALSAYTASTNGLFACKTWFFMPAMFLHTMTFSYVGIDCVKSSAGASASTVQVLIYSDNSGSPGTLLYNWGTGTNRFPNGNGIGYPVWLSGSFSATALTQYWIAVLVDGVAGNVNVSRLSGISDDMGFSLSGQGSATSDTLYKSGNTRAIVGTWLGGTPGSHSVNNLPGTNPSIGGLFASTFSLPLLAFAT